MKSSTVVIDVAYRVAFAAVCLLGLRGLPRGAFARRGQRR